MPGAGVKPIFRPRHQPGAHRIVMQVIDLLAQHLLGDDLLGMKPFLPDLIIAFDLGSTAYNTGIDSAPRSFDPAPTGR